MVRCGTVVGAFAMIGAGAIVTKDVPPFTLVLGFPVGDRKKICACGQTVLPLTTDYKDLILNCCKQTMSTKMLEVAQIKIEILSRTRI